MKLQEAVIKCIAHRKPIYSPSLDAMIVADPDRMLLVGYEGEVPDHPLDVACFEAQDWEEKA